MVRTLAIAIAVLAVSVVSARADVVRGKVKSTDTDKSTITVTADGKDQTITVAKNATITQPATGKKAKKLPPVNVTGGLGGLTSGADVAVTTERKDDADLATKIEVQAAAKKKKKNQ
jgi:hypothetical protein